VEPPYGDDSFVPDFQRELVGIGDTAELGIRARAATNVVLGVYALERFLDPKVSPIDSAIAQLTLGRGYMSKRVRRDFAKARQYFDALFKTDSYLAPEGGIGVAQCWLYEGKPDMAKQTFEDVVRRFPARKGLVEEKRRLIENSLQQLQAAPGQK
jgi:hypothetical protein